jgi:hypothetical protein
MARLFTRSKSLTVFALTVLIVLVLLLVGIRYVLVHTHPMFHEWSGIEHGLWTPTMPMIDGKGNYGYVDADLNMLVIVATKDPSIPESSRAEHSGLLPASSFDGRSARLLPATAYEVTVVAKRNTLLLLCHDGVTSEATIPPGAAEKLFDEIKMETIGQNSDDVNLLQELRKRSPEEVGEVVTEFIQANGL